MCKDVMILSVEVHASKKGQPINVRCQARKGHQDSIPTRRQTLREKP